MIRCWAKSTSSSRLERIQWYFTKFS